MIMAEERERELYMYGEENVHKQAASTTRRGDLSTKEMWVTRVRRRLLLYSDTDEIDILLPSSVAAYNIFIMNLLSK